MHRIGVGDRARFVHVLRADQVGTAGLVRERAKQLQHAAFAQFVQVRVMRLDHRGVELLCTQGNDQIALHGSLDQEASETIRSRQRAAFARSASISTSASTPSFSLRLPAIQTLLTCRREAAYTSCEIA